MMRWTRRRMLKAGAAGAGVSLLLQSRLFAQSGGATDLIRAPKLALVMGNSGYRQTPLKNPANDAKGMAEALRGAGFGVTMGLELDQPAMRGAIQSYTQSLARTRSVGVFYFGGHGAQLAWRNYLMPVDAEIGDVQELRERGVDVNSLIDGIRRAGNPMNIIILDACRDNPFGSIRKLEQKGLSQLDAPPGTLLAYATAPGNTAIDGEGEHGLYTENLLKEIRVPEAKVEDVFKRVRLAVRRRSHGLQIPWESTSLEEDFYFVPPRSLATLAEEESERARRQELARLEKQRTEEEAERGRRQEQALREAKLAAEEAERKRQQELALLEQKRVAEEIELKRKQELALQEARRVAEEAERKRREEQVLLAARLAQEEAERKYREELALRERQRAVAEAERKRKEEEALRQARLAEEEAARKHRQELASLEKRRAQEEAERRSQQVSASAPSKAPDPAQLERLLAEELAIWERIKGAAEPEALEDYLRRFPSGRFSELAMLRLDQVLAAKGEKKVEVISAPENPYTKGTVKANTAYKVGDFYAYRVLDLLTQLELRRPRRRVTEVTDAEVRFNDGRFVTDLLGNGLRFGGGAVYSPNQVVPTEFAVGRRWSTRFRVVPSKGGDTIVDFDLRIADRETIRVPAGEFSAFRVEATGWQSGMVNGFVVNSSWNWKTWYAPDRVRPFVAHEMFHRNMRNQIARAERFELTGFSQA